MESTMLMTPPTEEAKKRMALIQYLIRYKGREVLELSNSEEASVVGQRFRNMGIEGLNVDVSYNIVRLHMGS